MPFERIKGRFVKGSHWREPKPHWDKSWLKREYVDNFRSASSIAKESGCTEENILYWLRKHKIPRRDITTIRSKKYWGLTGESNGMFGRFGSLNPNYKDGSTPKRQMMYARSSGKEFLVAVYARDKYRCVNCGNKCTGPKTLHAHHIKPWAGNIKLRFDMSNMVTLCHKCHRWVHSKQNTERKFLL